LIDEALAVGDAKFQHKCLNKFGELKKEKKSIVLVSQSKDLIESFYEKTLYFFNGEERSFGPSEQVTNLYLDDLKSSKLAYEPPA